jgi:hypothetical protein
MAASNKQEIIMAAELKIPLDLPEVEVLDTEITGDGRLIIIVESQVETISCGICHQAIPCNYGHGDPLEVRHLSVLGLELVFVSAPGAVSVTTVCTSRPPPRS